jgi:hypothetical protein
VLAFCFFQLSLWAHAQIPVYNSYPSAEATVYLDFDGHLVQGTSWNMTGPISCGPSNLTNDQITEIFNRISEDYRPFNINITTDSTRYWSAPARKRMRVVFTITSAWYGAAGGVSYVGSFTWGDNTPDFVFTALLNYRTKYISEAASHEIGHTLGLRHQSTYDVNCMKTAEYNPGTGSGEIGWAPIMGVGYYRNFTLWNNGTNQYSCMNYQDDLGLIVSQNGFGYREDDHLNQPDPSAPLVNFTDNQFDVQGVIEQTTDRDVFRIMLPVGGGFHLDATPYNIGTGDIGSNLDMQVELLSSSENLLGAYNPSELLSSSIDTMLSPGIYYLRVEGKGNIYAPEYASLGSYSLKASFTPAGVLPVRKLELTGTHDHSMHRLDWLIDADEPVLEQTLEVASNGGSFHPVAQPASDIRTFSYVPANNGFFNYRLRAVFGSGRESYSNIIGLRNDEDKSRPHVTGNVIYNSVSVSSPSSFAYTIMDYSGRVVSGGNVPGGNSSIAAGVLSRGMYLIRFSKGQEQYVEKLMKQ